MSEIAISVENLSKLYQIGTKTSGTFREMVSGFFSKKNKESTDFWALKDVSFEVRKGEVLGVIGRNGAGKSTLLKLLSRITEPTTGRIKINGRVGSLLEVGTGFHPELTGRENVFLNGAILGMTREEVKGKFDEIVDFSGVEKFIDTPVKRYSSGMYVRLAFAVAANLEPDILIIDEVLAVGDVAFQKKCIGKMSEVAGHGRTVLFVSHNIQAMRTLCSSGLLLSNGKLLYNGVISETIKHYNSISNENIDILKNFKNLPQSLRRGNGVLRISDVLLYGKTKTVINEFNYDEDINIEVHIKSFEEVKFINVGFFLKSGITGESVTSYRIKIEEDIKPGQQITVFFKINGRQLRPGQYPIYLGISDENLNPIDILDNLLNPLVIYSESDFDQLGFDPTIHSGYMTSLVNHWYNIDK